MIPQPPGNPLVLYYILTLSHFAEEHHGAPSREIVREKASL